MNRGTTGFSPRTRIAGAAFSALLAMSLGGGLLPSAALADTATGSITITKVDGQGDVQYLGYKIFDATVNGDGTVSDIKWAGSDDSAKSATQNAVEGVIKSKDSSYSGTTAQDAAEWMSDNITGTNAKTIVEATSTAQAIAEAVDGLTSTATVKPGSSTSLEQGYWLFVTDPSKLSGESIGSDVTGTSPIFTVIGSEPVTATEKTSVPKVEKKVTSDASGQQVDVADAQVGQEVTYTLDGTVASNIATYDTYAYAFTDTLSNGLTYKADSTTVYVVNGATATKIDSGYTVTAPTSENGNVLTVSFKDLKSISGVSATSTIRVTYVASINANAVQGGTGNDNKVKITYSNNPQESGVGTSTEDEVKTYTYKLAIYKVDDQTKRALSGAKFTIQATNPDDAASNNKYVQSDGTLGESSYEFTTDASGQFNVSGLDAGIYTVTETAVPKTGAESNANSRSYDKVDPFTIEIKPTYAGESGMELTELAATLAPKENLSITSAGITTDGYVDAGVYGDGGAIAADSFVSKDTGTVQVTVRNRERIKLPLTGQQGIAVVTGAGLVIVAASVVALNRRRNREDEQA